MEEQTLIEIFIWSGIILKYLIMFKMFSYLPEPVEIYGNTMEV
jgi:hypothetical protein